MAEVMQFWFFSAALLAAAGWCVERLLRARGLQVRGVWLTTLVLSLLAPILPRLGAFRQAPDAPVLVDSATSLGTLALPMAPGPTPWSLAVPDVWIATAWVSLSLMLAGAVVFGVWRLARMRRSWRSTRIQDQPVLVSRSFGPAVVGVVRPEVVLPEEVAARSGADLDLVMRHEVEHVEARDPATLRLAALAIVLMPWNLPLIWQALRLRSAVEEDCDLRVIRGGANARAYGDLLVRMATTPRQSGFAFAALAERRSGLRRRLELLRDRGGQTRTAVTALLVIAGATAIGVWMGLPSPLQVWHDGAENEWEGNVVVRAETATRDGVVSFRMQEPAEVEVRLETLARLAELERLKASERVRSSRELRERVVAHERALIEARARVDHARAHAFRRQGDGVVESYEQARAEMEASERALESLRGAMEAVGGEGALGRLHLRSRAEGGVRILTEEQRAEADGDNTVLVRVRPRVSSDQTKPLIFIDGERATGELSDIDPDRIERVEVLKDGAAVRLYGEEAAGGVIQIFLKKR